MAINRRLLLSASAILLLRAQEGQSANAQPSGTGAVKMIDFGRARMDWLLPSGIRGSWRLIAASAQTKPAAGPDVYLAAGVMAGKIFGDGQLPIDPPFSFQVIASRDHHTIIRNGTASEAGSDTTATNASIFKTLDFSTPDITAKRIDLADVASGEVAGHWPLQVRVVARDQGQNEWSLQFPVSHVSDQTDKGRRRFQVETGPVLIPKQLLASSGIPSIGDHHLAYVFFNRLDRMDLLVLGRESGKVTGLRDFRHVQRLSDVEIEMYSAG